MPRDTGLRTDAAATKKRPFVLLSVSVVLIFTILACGFAEPDPNPGITRIVMRQHLPTITPTPLPGSEQVTDIAINQTGEIDETAQSAPPAAPVQNPQTMPATTELAAAPANSSVAIDNNAAADPANSAPVTAAGAEQQPTSQPVAAQPQPGQPLPTQTPVPTETPLPAPTDTPVPTSTPTVAPPTATPIPVGWAFNGVWSFYDPAEEGLLLLGELVNNTGVTQGVTAISGVFYDAQGQIIADGSSADFYVPLEVIPAGNPVPFELIVPGLQDAANFDLQVDAQPSNAAPRQDFQFSDVTTLAEDGYYCLTGQLLDPAGASDPVVVVAVLYNGQDQMVNYGSTYDYQIDGLAAGAPRPFEICVDQLGQEVARHELRAWSGALAELASP